MWRGGKKLIFPGNYGISLIGSCQVPPSPPLPLKKKIEKSVRGKTWREGQFCGTAAMADKPKLLGEKKTLYNYTFVVDRKIKMLKDHF